MIFIFTVLPRWRSGVGCHFPLQGIFLTQGLNPWLLHLLHWQVDSLPLSHPTATSTDYKWVLSHDKIDYLK